MCPDSGRGGRTSRGPCPGATPWPRSGVRPEPASQGSRKRFIEEDPDVCALARPRTLDGRRHVQCPACVGKRRRIVSPGRLVEVCGEEEAGLVEEQRIHSSDKGLPRSIPTRQVPPDNLVGHREKPSMDTVGALNARPLADACPVPTHGHRRVRSPIARSADSRSGEGRRRSCHGRANGTPRSSPRQAARRSTAAGASAVGVFDSMAITDGVATAGRCVVGAGILPQKKAPHQEGRDCSVWSQAKLVPPGRPWRDEKSRNSPNS